MIFHDDGEVVVENVATFVDEAQFEAVFILQGICLEVAKHSGCRQIVCKPGRSKNLRSGGALGVCFQSSLKLVEMFQCNLTCCSYSMSQTI